MLFSLECTANSSGDGVGTYNSVDLVPDLNSSKRDGCEKIAFYRKQGKVNLQNIHQLYGS
jgi:hypothetical protein